MTTASKLPEDALEVRVGKVTVSAPYNPAPSTSVKGTPSLVRASSQAVVVGSAFPEVGEPPMSRTLSPSVGAVEVAAPAL
jgi:hypothetical protein